MPCQLFAQKCSNCQEITKISKCLGSPPNTLPLVIYIGIFCYWVLLHYNMSFKTIAGGFNGAFWWYGPRSEDWEKKLTSLPKLSCGFKGIRQMISCTPKNWPELINLYLLTPIFSCANVSKLICSHHLKYAGFKYYIFGYWYADDINRLCNKFN